MSQKRTVLDLERYVPALITFISNKLSHGASSAYRRMFGVGITEWRLLAMLAIEPGISANRICQVMGYDKALVSRTLRVLDENGHVKIEADPQDSRRSVVTLTTAGYALHDRILAVALAREDQLLTGLSAAECDTLMGLLRRMLANTEAIPATGTALPRIGAKRIKTTKLV